MNLDGLDASLLSSVLSRPRQSPQDEPCTILTVHSLLPERPVDDDLLQNLQGQGSDDPTTDYVFNDGNGPVLMRLQPTPVPELGKRGPTKTLTYSLTARFYYGTASNDEWLVYKSALWLTSRHPHLAATLRDSEDGELCLIEATEALPDWISPENSENRVWLSGGELHLLPGGSKASPLSLPTALKSISPSTLAPAAVRSLLSSKASSASSEPYLHRAAAILPKRLAKVVRAHPLMVNKAVEAYCSSSPSNRPASLRRSLGEGGGKGHYVVTVVTFTRCLYAKLRHQLSIDGGAGPDVDGAYGEAEVGELEEFCGDGEGNGYLRDAGGMGRRLALGFEMLPDGWGAVAGGRDGEDWADWPVPGRGDVDDEGWLTYASFGELDDKMRDLAAGAGGNGKGKGKGEASGKDDGGIHKDEKQHRAPIPVQEKDLEEITRHMSNFMRKGAGDVGSSEEGGRPEEGDVVIDPEKFLKILEAAMGEVEEGGCREEEEEEEDGGGATGGGGRFAGDEGLRDYFSDDDIVESEGSEEDSDSDGGDGDGSGRDGGGDDGGSKCENNGEPRKEGEEDFEPESVVNDSQDESKVRLSAKEMDKELGTRRPEGGEEGDDALVEVDADIVSSLIEDIMGEDGGTELANHFLESMEEDLGSSVTPPPPPNE